jgi:hypothetical protein
MSSTVSSHCFYNIQVILLNILNLLLNYSLKIIASYGNCLTKILTFFRSNIIF